MRNFDVYGRRWIFCYSFLWINFQWLLIFYVSSLLMLLYLLWQNKILFPAGIYLLKVNNRNIRKRCEIYSKLIIETPKQRQWLRSVVLIVKFEHTSRLVLMFLLLTLNMLLPAGFELKFLKEFWLQLVIHFVFSLVSIPSPTSLLLWFLDFSAPRFDSVV